MEISELLQELNDLEESLYNISMISLSDVSPEDGIIFMDRQTELESRISEIREELSSYYDSLPEMEF